MNNIDILYKINKKNFLFKFDSFDNLSTINIKVYNKNKFFLYLWYSSGYQNQGKKRIDEYIVIELNNKDLEDISLKKYPLIHFLKSKKTYLESVNFTEKTKYTYKYEIYNITKENAEEKILPKNYYLEELEELKLYLMKNKVNNF